MSLFSAPKGVEMMVCRWHRGGCRQQESWSPDKDFHRAARPRQEEEVGAMDNGGTRRCHHGADGDAGRRVFAPCNFRQLCD